METMITNLLTMARTGTTLEEPSPVSIQSVAEEAWSGIWAREATLECDLEDGWTVPGDHDQLLHVFENLFRNAVEHNDSPITVRVAHIDDDPNQGFSSKTTGEDLPRTERSCSTADTLRPKAGLDSDSRSSVTWSRPTGGRSPSVIAPTAVLDSKSI